MDWIGVFVAAVLILLGLAGTVLPLLPGAPLIVLGMVAYGYFNGFAQFTTLFWVGQIILLIIIFIVDYVAGAVGTQKFGGSKGALWGSIVGALVGLFTMGPLGIILGPFIGAVLGELIAGGNLSQSVKVGFGSIVGFVGGTVVKLMVEIVMIVWFLIVVL